MGMLPGFSGERCDAFSDAYHLGNGYRAYSPRLMRFTCPDSASPFGPGGVNSYAYCVGDPVNRLDPSGHLSRQAWIGIAVGGIALAFTVGPGLLAISAANGIMAAIASASPASMLSGITGVIAEALGIGSIVLKDADPKASLVLGWVSLSAGSLSLANITISRLLRNLGDQRSLRASSLELQNLASTSANTAGRPTSAHPYRSPFTYSDDYRRMVRLNIVGQTRFVKGKLRLRVGPDEFASPEKVARMLSEATDFDLREHAYIRLICNFTAEYDRASFAGRLSRILNRPVEGYSGIIPLKAPSTPGRFAGVYHDRLVASDVVQSSNPFRMIGHADAENEVLSIDWTSCYMTRTFRPGD